MQNTDEWSKREQLETEKFQLEREIKKFKNQIADLEVRKKKKEITPKTLITIYLHFFQILESGSKKSENFAARNAQHWSDRAENSNPTVAHTNRKHETFWSQTEEGNEWKNTRYGVTRTQEFTIRSWS